MTLTTSELKKIIMARLNTQPQVDSVGELLLTQKNEAINVVGQITAKGYDVGFSGDLVNAGKNVDFSNLDIDAGFFVKTIIRGYLKNIPKLIKKFLEDEYGRKFASIQVTSKGLELN